jgi:D-alanyl-D-alanine carboxypeptidase (penicillin-binding protein 5/6)
MKICQMDKKYSKTLNKTWTSTNELIKEGGEYYYQYCLGMKTGSTGLAGKCFVSVASKDSVTCISVVLNDTTEEQRWKDSLNLLNYGLNKK